jgi:membrane fusion protein (multidrug efflux system)
MGRKFRFRISRRIIRVYVPVFLVVALVVAIGVYYYIKHSKYVSTDDALVDGNTVSLSPKVLGRIAKLHADEGDIVQKGQLLVELDSSDLISQKLQAISNVQLMQTNVQVNEAKLQSEKANIKVLEINADKAKTDYDRAEKQKAADVITEEQYDNIKKNYQSAVAQLEAAKSQLKVLEKQIESARAAERNGYMQTNVITTQLQNMRLYSPFDGVIAKRWLLEGDVAQPGQAIFSINYDKKIWVSVYLEETKLKDIYLGQKCEYSIDAFPSTLFYGKVFLISNSTSSRFSIIPPSNASGNFTKITQRVQLKVSIDSASVGKVNNYEILPGMSVVIKLIK